MNPLERAKKGDKNGFAELFSESVPAVYYICLKLLGSAAATDAAAETYKKVFSSLSKLPEETNFNEWIKTAAAITCCNYLRRADREVFLSEPTVTPYNPVGISNGSSLNMSETASLIENCLDSFPISVKTAVLLYYFNGLTLPQLARIMCVPPATAKERLIAGRDVLEGLQLKLRQLNITTCKITLLPIFEFCSSVEIIPHDLNLDAVYTPEDTSELPEPEEPRKPSISKSAKKMLGLLISGAAIVAAAAVILSALPKNQGKDKKNTESGAARTSAASDTAISSEPVVSTPPAPIIITEYKAATIECFNENGEKDKSYEFSYNESGELISSKSATEIFEETLNYTYNKSKTLLTVPGQEGERVEKTEFDSEGYPITENYGEDKSVSYKWEYEKDALGRITTASYKSDVSGKMTYKYNEKGKISYLGIKSGDITVVWEFSYDEKDMIVSAVFTDDGGEKTLYTCSYDYDALTFTCSVGDGRAYSGTLASFTREVENN